MEGNSPGKLPAFNTFQTKYLFRFHGGENAFSRDRTPAVGNHNETPSSQQRIHTETESHDLSDTKKGFIFLLRKS